MGALEKFGFSLLLVGCLGAFAPPVSARNVDRTNAEAHAVAGGPWFGFEAESAFSEEEPVDSKSKPTRWFLVGMGILTLARPRRR